jgi:CrcB protein
MSSAAEAPRRPRHVLAYRRDLAAIFAGGCVGAVARAALAEAFPADPGQWPWATLIANLLGAFALGWINTVLPPQSVGRPLLGTGLCGALTTFSTLQLELLRMLEAGEGGRAAAYLSVSVVAGLIAVVAATALVRGRSPER